MSDILDQLRRVAYVMFKDGWQSKETAGLAFLEITALRAEITLLQKELETATGYAERLSVALMEKHFPEATTWKPLSGDLIGILTQIDNLTTGLCRKGGRE